MCNVAAVEVRPRFNTSGQTSTRNIKNILSTNSSQQIHGKNSILKFASLMRPRRYYKDPI